MCVPMFVCVCVCLHVCVCGVCVCKIWQLTQAITILKSYKQDGKPQIYLNLVLLALF
jgi:hypothetical protein